MVKKNLDSKFQIESYVKTGSYMMFGEHQLILSDDLESDEIDFLGIRDESEQKLSEANSEKDLNILIKSLNPLLKDDRLSVQERYELKKLRQRAYDRRRNSKFKDKVGVSESSNVKMLEIKKANPAEIMPLTEYGRNDGTKLQQETENKDNGAKGDDLSTSKVSHVNYLWLFISICTAAILYLHSVILYRSLGFDNASLSAIGGLMIVISFAIYQSRKKSIISILLCVYIGAYEGYIVIVGTISEGKGQATHEMENTEKIQILKESLSRAKDEYIKIKEKYDDRSSKLYINVWYSKNYLTPSFDRYKGSVTALENAKIDIEIIGMTQKHHILSKILYRLALVFLLMIGIHRIFCI